ncbi:MAG TPA: SDR family NAD(P)-dependent oxidoreductase [Rhodanobacteraceae bacterium]|nr:SDR family NAD(P)-dependent oxidoreductase [Rhodanobacteraceae bacterium]
MSAREATAIVIGASSGLGRALAAALAREGYALLLVASDRRDLDALGASLNLEHGIAVRALALDLAREADPGARIAATLDGMPPASALLLPIGRSRDDDDLSLDAGAIGQLLAVNLHGPLAIVHALLPRLVESHGVVVLFGSVAATRGRGRNVVYASAKRALVSLYESLRQRYRDRELRVQLYELGFMATNLTYGMKLPLPAVEPEAVARTVVRRLRSGSSRRYLPRWWALVAMLVRWMPWFVYRRMKG